MSDSHVQTNAILGGAAHHLQSLLKLEEGVDYSVPIRENIEDYLYERYARDSQGWKRKAYYFAKPLIPRRIQLALRKKYADIQAQARFPAWPIEPILVESVREYMRCVVEQSEMKEIHRIAPWPERKHFAFAITHDVEWDAGLRNAPKLAEIEKKLGFVSSWNIVPERYPIDWAIVEKLRSEGCEIGVHGLKHDGKLFQSRRIFENRVRKINQYAKEWGAVGFRSPSTLRNVEWMPELEFEYDSSFPDTDPYEPQAGGCCSIWPFFIKNLVELPITMPQDHTLYEVLGHQDISIWKEKADWIATNSGLILIDVHPDYMSSEKRLQFYESFLSYVKNKNGMWHALPREIVRWWRERDSSSLRKNNASYIVEGPASPRASIMRTSLANGTITDQFLD